MKRHIHKTKKELDEIYHQVWEWAVENPGYNLWNQSGKELEEIFSINMSAIPVKDLEEYICFYKTYRRRIIYAALSYDEQRSYTKHYRKDHVLAYMANMVQHLKLLEGVVLN